MERTSQDSDTAAYKAMRDAIVFMRAHAHERPSPADIAHAVGMDASRFARTFKAWVGLPPKRYLSHLTKERAKDMLRASKDVLTASVRSGISSPGRLHDLLVNHESVSPGEYKHGRVSIRWGIHPSPFGFCLIGITKRGICLLVFLEKNSESAALRALKDAWPNAVLTKDQRGTHALLTKLFGKKRRGKPLSLVVRGTNFQMQVWNALLNIPEGRAATYAQIAQSIGKPRAVRAVGSACGKNPIGYLIPCHRVLTADGRPGGYKWRPERKEVILAWEQARRG